MHLLAGPNDTIISGEIKTVTESNKTRVGCANMALARGEPYVLQDFAHGVPEYNDVLDSADMAHVQRVHSLQKEGLVGSCVSFHPFAAIS